MKIHVEDPVVTIAQLSADGSFLFPGFDFHLTHLILSLPLHQFIILFPKIQFFFARVSFCSFNGIVYMHGQIRK